jgi:hypothetical protein
MVFRRVKHYVGMERQACDLNGIDVRLCWVITINSKQHGCSDEQIQQSKIVVRCTKYHDGLDVADYSATTYCFLWQTLK